ncbi:formate dehydrogenase accessory protein FdhE [Neisseria lisongii]|uniref:Formate dehydrogenase accessory protein FdhE n=1 Tax=Neisseria lisongii TaxID=2912188 RepID=A0AAW5AMU4_9NEIS|nr:formate dehydrogenase accessory protein FdhE [Neisseria lisongii]MCF7529263.1 formate dehydrogenase accessory protein FdhE [Neisseria lisongii]
MNTTTTPKGLFHTPFRLAPEQNVFANRAVRFKELAEQERSDWKDYLLVLAAVCDAQHAVSQDFSLPLPENTVNGILPKAQAEHLPEVFAEIVYALLNKAQPHIQTAAVLQEISTLQNLKPSEIRRLAGEVFDGTCRPAAEIWIQAALQIVWTAWAAQVGEDDVAVTEERTHCPCCGTPAVGSVVLIQSDLSGLRYMYCPLCNSRWNALRAKCPTCGDGGNVRLQHIESGDTPDLPDAYTAAHAESCKSCHTYRKLYRRDKQQYADPIADDLATLGLDIAVGEAGFERSGANPFLILTED